MIENENDCRLIFCQIVSALLASHMITWLAVHEVSVALPAAEDPRGGGHV